MSEFSAVEVGSCIMNNDVRGAGVDVDPAYLDHVPSVTGQYVLQPSGSLERCGLVNDM